MLGLHFKLRERVRDQRRQYWCDQTPEKGVQIGDHCKTGAKHSSLPNANGRTVLYLNQPAFRHGLLFEESRREAKEGYRILPAAFSRDTGSAEWGLTDGRARYAPAYIDQHHPTL